MIEKIENKLGKVNKLLNEIEIEKSRAGKGFK